MNGGLLGLVFLGLVAFSLFRSGDRWMTVLYMLMAMGLTFGAVLVIAFIVPSLNKATVGSSAFDGMLLVGALAALIHSRKSRTSI